MYYICGHSGKFVLKLGYLKEGGKMNKLKRLRERAELTLRKLEDYVDISYTVLHKLEKGERPFRELHILKLADFFDVRSDYLLGYSKSGIGIYFESSEDDEDHVFISEEEYYQILSKHNIEETIIIKDSTSEIVINLPEHIIKEYSGRYKLFRSARIAKEKSGIDLTVRNEIAKELDRMDIHELEKLLKFIKEYFK